MSQMRGGEWWVTKIVPLVSHTIVKISQGDNLLKFHTKTTYGWLCDRTRRNNEIIIVRRLWWKRNRKGGLSFSRQMQQVLLGQKLGSLRSNLTMEKTHMQLNLLTEIWGWKHLEWLKSKPKIYSLRFVGEWCNWKSFLQIWKASLLKS